MLCLDDTNKFQDFAYRIRWTLDQFKMNDTDKIQSIKKIANDITNLAETIEAREKFRGV
jgi:hypothetical protein